MAIALHDQRVIAGQRIGISSAYAALIYLVIICITPMNVYHLSNLFLNLAGTAWWSHLVYPMSTAITLAEIPLVQAFVTNYRLDPKSAIVKAQGLILALLVSLTVMGGNVSQFISADIKDASIQSHQTTENSFDQKQKVIDENWRRATRKANKIKSKSKRDDAISDANTAYYSASADLNDGLSKHQVKRPTLGVENGSFAHVFLVNVVSLALVIVSMSLSGFLAVYYSTLVASPAFSFMSKKAHEWLSTASNFTAANHEISPIDDKQSGMVKVDKSAATAVDQNHPTKNRPALDETRVNDQNSVSGRTLEQDTKNGEFTLEQYSKLKGEIIAGNLPPTVRSIKAWLRANKIGDTDKTRSGITDKILAKMKDENLIVLNPEQGKTDKILAKYVLNPDSQNQGRPVVEQGADKMISSICPECKHQSKVSTSNLRKWGGMVGCPECAHSYTVKGNQVKRKAKIIPAAGVGLTIGEDGISPTLGAGALITK